MPWITTISYEDADCNLRQLYDRVKGPDNNIDNIMMMHSLRPHTMEGHMAIYKYVLHHTQNTLPKWYLETIGIWVSSLNHCDYCVEHHFSGLKRLLDNEQRADALRASIELRDINTAPLNKSQKLGLVYAQQLTVNPSALTEDVIIQLRSTGLSDGEILEINQVTAYFNYANRTVLGLGCSTAGDILGLSPNNSDNPNDWSHT